MLLHPQLGSWFFIGVLLTTADLAHDQPLADRCGTCRACLDACPTDAFVAPYVLDARRCVSYLTIEHRGDIEPAAHAGMAGWQFGCDRGAGPRSVPAAGGRVHHHVPRRPRHRDRGRVPAEPDGPGPNRLGPAEGLGRPLQPGPGLAGEGAHRAAVLDPLGAPGTTDPRGRPGAAGDLGLLAGRRAARLPRTLLPLRPHDALLQPGANRASAHPDLPGRGQSADVPDRGGGRGRPARPLLPQRALPARVRAPRGAGGAQSRRPLAHRLHLPRLDDGGAGRLRGGAAPERAGGEEADRVLRVDADLSGGPRGPRARRARPAPAREVARGRLGGHGRSHQRRDAGSLRGERVVRNDRAADPRAVPRPLRPHPALPVVPALARRSTLARRPRRLPRRPRAYATIRPREEIGMAILKVARLGHPVLRKVAAPVPIGEIRSTETQRLIHDMIETIREYNGAGLAAPQVHSLKQICVIEVHGNPRYPDAPAIPLTVLINPVVTPLTDEIDDGWEGCLSVPDMRGVVPRFGSVRLEARDREGNPIDVVAKEFFARVIQHETDHLNGIVYVDRMRDLSTLTHLAEWNKYWLGVQEQDD